MRIVLADAAQRDLREVLLWSEEQFGQQAARRYRDLLKQAIRDIAADPERPGSQARRELAPGVRTYHLFFSRSRARKDLGVVGKPRHLLVYRLREGAVDVIRILHDARELERHLPREYLREWESGSGKD